jgi:phenylpyruvate tautomerase PptA (4-oxalocrotonate tautomerase family)
MQVAYGAVPRFRQNMDRPMSQVRIDLQKGKDASYLQQAERITSEQKSKIASEITKIHGQVTGVPGFFAQVIFNEVDPGDWFMGGAPLKHDHIFVYGHIRAGRAALWPNSREHRSTGNVFIACRRAVLTTSLAPRGRGP